MSSKNNNDQTDDSSDQGSDESPTTDYRRRPLSSPNDDILNIPTSSSTFLHKGIFDRSFENPRSGLSDSFHSGPLPLDFGDVCNKGMTVEGLWNDDGFEHNKYGALVNPQGFITIILHCGLRVDLTCDQAIRITSDSCKVALALSANGSSAALIHPSGLVYQYGSRVEIKSIDERDNNKFAKMWYKGVSFTSDNCAVVYLVDTAGTRTTTDIFSDMSGDFTIPVFTLNSKYGEGNVAECQRALSHTHYWVTPDGTENWAINQIRVSQAPDGLVRVGRETSKYQLRTSPLNGTVSITTPFVHCTASTGSSSHLFVKRGERRMHYDGTSFIIRNGGHSAGFNERNQLKVY